MSDQEGRREVARAEEIVATVLVELCSAHNNHDDGCEDEDWSCCDEFEGDDDGRSEVTTMCAVEVRMRQQKWGNMWKEMIKQKTLLLVVV